MRRVLAAAALLAMVSCGGGTATVDGLIDLEGDALEVAGDSELGGGTDVAPFEAAPGDLLELAGPEVDATGELADLQTEPGEPGYPCGSGADCNSGYCVYTPEGKQCSTVCEDECPFGWTCALHEPSLPDQVFICVPGSMAPCSPCDQDGDCFVNGVDLGDRCVTYGPVGSFCAPKCDDGQPCPEGYDCQPAAGGDMRCIYSLGLCPCSAWAIAEVASTSCSNDSEAGSCEGERVCTVDGLSACSAPTPAAESCNGADDDCDGTADEDLTGPDCSVSNAHGTCTGTEECLAGKLFCSAQEPAPEACDGLDNNCDGTVDEGYPDTDKDGLKDCMETDKDDDGAPDGEDNCPAIQNPEQEDFDLDGDGDACDLDDDNDLVADGKDNCPLAPNPLQEDIDKDGTGDACDVDKDGDGIPQGLDNCPSLFNPGQQDTDADGTGDACDGDADGDSDPDGNDCAPENPAIFHGAKEECDGADNDCDSEVDEGFPDSDADGLMDCVDPDDDNDGDLDATDCEPLSPTVFHGAQEACDGIDNNCVKGADEGFPDFDLDGDKDCVDADDDNDLDADATDCAPQDPAVFHSAVEGCDGVDDDCDGMVDDGFGDQQCGLGQCVHSVPKCQDGALVFCNPFAGATAEACDGQDNDCDGAADEELGMVSCGFGSCFHEVPACENGKPSSCDPKAGAVPEACDGQDNDCDGLIDEGLGTTSCGLGVCGHSVPNCLDGKPQTCDPMQGAQEETCNGTDDDCDGSTDEGLGTTTCGAGACAHTVDNCAGGKPLMCDPLQGALDEACNGTDDDCDGQVDDGLGTTACGVGACAHTVDNCLGGLPQGCDPFEGAADEACNGLDDDCDGLVDEALGTTTCGVGACAHTVNNCAGGKPQACDPMAGSVPDVCGNGADDDCNGKLDDACPLSCLAIKTATPAATDGFYFVDLDGFAGPAPAFEAWCDMTVDGGGWTRFFWLKSAYPNGVDPFKGDVWSCDKAAPLCLAGIPKGTVPKDLLVKDVTDKAHAAWHFSGSNAISNAVLAAMRDRTKQCIYEQAAFQPYVYSGAEQFCGTGIEGGCDSFYYTDAVCGAGKTKAGWGVNFDGDTGCYSSAIKLGDVSTNCCGCNMSGPDWGFLNYTDVQNEWGEIYYR